jgi:hypothetical protein
MEQNKNDEIDLGFVFRKLGGAYKALLVNIFRLIQFVFNKWYIFLSLIIFGVIAGYYMDKTSLPSKQATLIAQINFDGSNYIYDAIEQLNGKIKEYDTLSLQEWKFYEEGEILIYNVEIEPIVNIFDILDDAQTSDRNIEVLLEQSQYTDDLLMSEMFIPQYKSHRIIIQTSPLADDSVIQYLLNYLNSNEILNQIKDVTIHNSKRKISQNLQSIAYMDSIFKVYGTLVKADSQPNQVSFSSYDVNNGSIHMMFREKKEIQEEIEDLEVELLKYDNIIEVINKPLLKVQKSFFANKTKFLPLFLVVLFLIATAFRNLYLRAKRLSEENS